MFLYIFISLLIEINNFPANIDLEVSPLKHQENPLKSVQLHWRRQYPKDLTSLEIR